MPVLGTAADAAGPIPTAKSIGIDQNGMNKNTLPGDDFYGFTNGGRLARTEIPVDRGSWGAGSELAEASNVPIIALIEAIAKNKAAATPAARSRRIFTPRKWMMSPASRPGDWRH